MKFLTILNFLFLLSTSAQANNECIRYMVNQDQADVVWQKKCHIITEDTGKIELISAKACLSKLKKPLKNKISYALVVDLERKDTFVKKDLIIFNTTNARESNAEISIDIKTMSPELLFKRTHSKIKYDKITNSLDVIVEKGRLSLSNAYKFQLECK